MKAHQDEVGSRSSMSILNEGSQAVESELYAEQGHRLDQNTSYQLTSHWTPLIVPQERILLNIVSERSYVTNLSDMNPSRNERSIHKVCRIHKSQITTG